MTHAECGAGEGVLGEQEGTLAQPQKGNWQLSSHQRFRCQYQAVLWYCPNKQGCNHQVCLKCLCLTRKGLIARWLGYGDLQEVVTIREGDAVRGEQVQVRGGGGMG